MSIGTNPPFGWGGDEPVEVDVKLNVGARVALGSPVALDIQDTAASGVFDVGKKDNILHHGKEIDVASETGGFRGIVTDLMGSDGDATLVSKTVRVTLRGIVQALVGSASVSFSVAAGDRVAFQVSTAQGTAPYLEANDTAGTGPATNNDVAGLCLAAAFTTDSTIHTPVLKQVAFDGIGRANGSFPA